MFMYYTLWKEEVKLWSPQLRLSSHLHVVVKEHAHKCNQYLDSVSIPDLEKEIILR